MVFPVVGGTQSTGDFITNSLRLNDDDSPKLARTPSTEGNRKTFSISFWQKKANMNHGNDYLIQVSGTNDTTNFEVSNHSTHAFQVGLYSVNLIRTTRLFRDPSAWTHFFFFIDTTQASESNRFQLYVNGIQETDFSQTNIPSQNADIGLGRDVATTFFNSIDAYISDFHYIDGIKKAHTDFGEFDTNGVWVPKEYDGSYGNQGIRLEFKQTGTSANASGIGADTSGNGNHLTPTNLAATDVTTDTPTNNFCTWNPLDAHSGQTLSEGNTKNVAANNCRSVNSNFGVSQGKWYFEYKVKVVNANAVFAVPQNLYPGGTDLFSKNYTTGLYGPNPSIYRNGSNVLSNLNGTTSDDDIIMWAMDLDNNNIYFGKDGQWTDGNGFDQSDFSNATAYALTRDSNDSFVVIATTNGSSGSGYTLEMNWGNPPFSISSGNADANGYGNFEYAVPSGYYSLCTKNLAEFG